MLQSLPDFIHTLRDPSALITAVGLVGITAIIFIETGLLFPMLPGDSLLVTAGLLASQTDGPVHLNIWVLGVCCSCAAILGNSSGYLIGQRAGHALFKREDSRWFKRSHLVRAHEFYERHGGATIIIAQFMPIVRTFAPFVAGVGAMKHSTFQLYSALGGILWVASFVALGYFFGNIPFVKTHLAFIMLGVIVISLLPLAWAAVARKRAGNAAR